MHFGIKYTDSSLPSVTQNDTLTKLSREFLGRHLVLAGLPKRTQAEVGEQKSEKPRDRGTPRSDLTCHVGMILVPARDAANQSEPEEQKSRDFQPKNLAHPPKRPEKTIDSSRNPLKNSSALLPFLKRSGHFAQRGTDRGRRRRLGSQRIRKTTHKAILEQFVAKCILKKWVRRPRQTLP